MKQFLLFQNKNWGLKPKFYYSSRGITSLHSLEAVPSNDMLYECANFTGRSYYRYINYQDNGSGRQLVTGGGGDICLRSRCLQKSRGSTFTVWLKLLICTRFILGRASWSEGERKKRLSCFFPLFFFNPWNETQIGAFNALAGPR